MLCQVVVREESSNMDNLPHDIKLINQRNYLQKADIPGDTVNREDAIDVDDNDGKLTKLSNASDQVSQTIVSDIFNL